MIGINACIHKTAPKFSHFLLLAFSVLPGMGVKRCHTKCVRELHNAVSRVTCCPPGTGWAGLS